MSLDSMQRRLSAAGLLLAIAAFPGQAGAQRRDSSAGNELLLDGQQTVFTATKKSQRVSDVPAAVTVITEEDIKLSGATTIPDLLRSVPGVDVMEPNQSQANISIRGFNGQYANKLLVMVDGRSIYEDFFGGVFWNTDPMLLSRIKRIEIVRGPGSALYGANAFGGVINIITKTPEELASGRTNAQAFSFLGEHDGNFSETMVSAGKATDWSFAFGAGYHHTNGYGERQAGQVRDSYSVPILTADLEKKVKRGSWRLVANNADARADLSSVYFLSDADWHTQSVALRYNEDKGPNPISARLFTNYFRINEGAQRDVDTRTYDFEIQQQYALSPRHALVYGSSYRNTWINATLINNQAHSQDLWSLYLQDEYHLAAQTSLFAGVRMDKHSLYGTNVTPRASLVHHMPKEQTLRLSYGTAFRTPTLLDSYYDYTFPIAPGVNGHFQGNPDLKPEKVTSVEAGYRKELKGGYMGLTLFHNEVSGLIKMVPVAFAPSPPFPAGIGTQYMRMNALNGRASGLELESAFRVAKGWKGLFNYSYEDVVDSNGQPVDFSPHNKVNFSVMSDDAKRLSTYLAVHYVDASTLQNNGTILPISPYTRIDARVGYRFGRLDHPWTLSLAASNLLNDGHYEFPLVNQAGTGIAATPQGRTLWVMLNGKL